MTLDQLVAQFEQRFGESLVAIVLYGSAATDEHVPSRSDHNVLVIVESLTFDALQSLGQTAQAWQEAGNPPPLMLSRSEWLGSSDVFPMEYADILERHRVLAGALPTGGIRVSPADLRLQVEQEALGKVLRLRRAVMMAGTDATRQRDLLRESWSAFMVILRGVARLHGESPSRDAATVVQSVTARCHLNAQPYVSVLQLVRGGEVSDVAVSQLLADYLTNAEALVAYLDTFVPAKAG